MHIAFFVVKHLDLGGGIEKYTRELSTRLAARGHEITIYSMRHYGHFEKMINGVRVVGVPTIPFRATEKLVASASAAVMSLFHKKPDVAHFHSVAAGLFAPICRSRGIARVLQMHGIEWRRSRWGGFGSSTLRFLERRSMRGMDAYTAVSRVQCKTLSAEYGLQVEYIPTGADVPEPVPAEEIRSLGLEPRQYIFFASRLVREKGAHYLIPAYRKLDTHIKLVIAGDANGEESYKDELQRLAAGDPRITFPGFVQGRLLQELFSNARLYVQPSEIEGLSIALLEAMGYGNACLVSNIPENEEALGDNGFYFQSKSIPDLSRELEALIKYPEIIGDAGERARIRVHDWFSWDRITDAFENLYERVRDRQEIKEFRSHWDIEIAEEEQGDTKSLERILATSVASQLIHGNIRDSAVSVLPEDEIQTSHAADHLVKPR